MPRKRRTDFQYTADGNGEVTAEKLARDTFPTPYNIASAAVHALRLPYRADEPLMVLDVGAGNGVWGTCFKERYPQSILHGCEVRDVPMPAGYDRWFTTDFLTVGGQYDVLVGNIPFSLAEPFIRHGLTLLAPQGRMVFLLRAQFNGGQDRYRQFWKDVHLEAEYYCASRMPFITKINKQTGRREPASDVWDYSLFQFANEWREDWWKTYRWDYKTPTDREQFSLFDTDPLA